jgi:uncharacterized membrane protein
MKSFKVAITFFAVLLLTVTLAASGVEAASSKQRKCQNQARKYADDKMAVNVVGGTLLGAGIGAGVGAIVGGKKSTAIGAGIGAGTGAIGGSVRGSERWNHHYNKKYYKCMNNS